MAEMTKIGIIACSGEEIPAGTISRLATRRVLELLRPQSTVTLCLPLFLAGEEQERRFAKQHPTITVDGCDKHCAKWGTQQHSGPAAASLVVAEIVGDRLAQCHRSARDFSQVDEEAVWLVAERIAAEVDVLLAAASLAESAEPVAAPQAGQCACACGSSPGEGNLEVGGKKVAVNGLPLIFDRLRQRGLAPGAGCAERLLETVRIYHAIPPEEDAAYREALAAAYGKYWESGQKRDSADKCTPAVRQANTRASRATARLANGEETESQR